MKQSDHNPSQDQTIQLVLRFNEALNRKDVDGMMALMTEAPVFENTYPPPDGARYAGSAAVRSFWEEFFTGSQQASIEVEEIFAAGNRCIMLWKYRWVGLDGAAGHIRGVDVYTVEGNRIAAKKSYVKG